MAKARLTKVAGKIIINTPYHATLVEEIKGIPGRRWNPDSKVWSVPAGSEEQARELVRHFFQIEGEDIHPEKELDFSFPDFPTKTCDACGETLRFDDDRKCISCGAYYG